MAAGIRRDAYQALLVVLRFAAIFEADSFAVVRFHHE
jgi:hypothetical protein